MKKVNCILLVIILLALGIAPAMAQTVQCGPYSFDLPEELGTMTACEDDGKYYFSFEQNNSNGVPDGEWRVITIYAQDRALSESMSTKEYMERFKQEFLDAGMPMQAVVLGPEFKTFFELNLTQLNGLENSFSYVNFREGAIDLVRMDNIQRDIGRQLMAALRVDESAAASDQAILFTLNKAAAPVASTHTLKKPAVTFGVPEGIYVLEADETDAKILSEQSFTQEQLQQYAKIGNTLAFLIPKGSNLRDCAFHIAISINENDFELLGDDFRKLGPAQLDSLVNHIAESDLRLLHTGQQLPMRQAGGLPFGGLLARKTELLYFTLLNNQRVNISLFLNSGDFTAERQALLHAVTDSFDELKK